MESQAWNTWESGLMPGDVMFFFFFKEQRVITSLTEKGWGKTFSKGTRRYIFFFKVMVSEVLQVCIRSWFVV